jgi:hypothetical protein
MASSSRSKRAACARAANRWAAEWDWQLVAEALQTINSDELRALTGFRDDELKNLMAADWSTPTKGDLMGAQDTADAHAVHLSATQYDLLTNAKARLDPTGAISDAHWRSRIAGRRCSRMTRRPFEPEPHRVQTKDGVVKPQRRAPVFLVRNVGPTTRA